MIFNIAYPVDLYTYIYICILYENVQYVICVYLFVHVCLHAFVEFRSFRCLGVQGHVHYSNTSY